MSDEHRISLLLLKHAWTGAGAATTIIGLYDIYLYFTQSITIIISTILQSIPALIGASSAGTFFFIYAKKVEKEKLARFVIRTLENTLARPKQHLEFYEITWDILNENGDSEVAVHRKLDTTRPVYLYAFQAGIAQDSGSDTQRKLKLNIHNGNRVKLPYYLTEDRPHVKRGVIIFDPPVKQEEFWVKYKWKGVWKPLFSGNRRDKAKVTLEGETDRLTLKILFPERITNVSAESIRPDGTQESLNLTTDSKTGRPCLEWTIGNAGKGDYHLHVNVIGLGH